MEQEKSLNKKPMVLLFAGPNGSGKSTITGYFDIVGSYTNADDIVRSTGMDNLQAAQRVDELRYQSIEKREDFTFESVLSSDYKMNLLREAKESGYFIKCVFVLTISPQLNVARVMSRVQQGGHDVERNKIISRYWKSIKNIPEILDICDIVHVYDNTDKPTRIIRKHKNEFSIFPNTVWSAEQIMALINGCLSES